MRFQSLNFTNPECSEWRYYQIGSGRTNKRLAEQSHNLCPANNILNRPYFKKGDDNFLYKGFSFLKSIS